jgi:hypothetical protein
MDMTLNQMTPGTAQELVSLVKAVMHLRREDAGHGAIDNALLHL